MNEMLRSVPWITENGILPGKLPIESLLKQTLSDDENTRRVGIKILQIMHQHGRPEAGIYLLGYLISSGSDDFEKRSEIVEALKGFNTKACADVLFGEIKGVKSSNTSRRYLKTILKILSEMPRELTETQFQALVKDKSFSYRMRNKFKAMIFFGPAFESEG